MKSPRHYATILNKRDKKLKPQANTSRPSPLKEGGVKDATAKYLGKAWHLPGLPQNSPKELLRDKYKQLRKQLDNKQQRSAKIMAALQALPEFKNAKSLLLYYSKAEEVDTHKLIDTCLAQKRKVYLPFVDEVNIGRITTRQDLVQGEFGVMVPKYRAGIYELESIDLALIPGLAFDRKGRRLGYGKGWYDMLLSSLNPRVTKIGLCFDCQLADSVPHTSHDQKLSLIVTESEVIKIV